VAKEQQIAKENSGDCRPNFSMIPQHLPHAYLK
jgi:hypothetical protein